MKNSVKLYKSTMKLLNKRKKYKYQLTRYLPRKELDSVIQQIEEYEGKNRGYYLRENNGKWAVFTEGSYIVKETHSRNPQNKTIRKDPVLSYKQILQIAKR